MPDHLLGSNVKPIFALVGHPNAGKTTLFNHLTGLKQKIGNYAGVTVEKKEGYFYTQHGHPIKIIDLPGIYSLNSQSIDENVTQQALLGHLQTKPNALLITIDSTLLDRHLYLILRLLELNYPSVLILTMTDLAEKQGISIDIDALKAFLKIPIIAIHNQQTKSILPLRILLSRPIPQPTIWPLLLTEAITNKLDPLIQYGVKNHELSNEKATLEALLSLLNHQECPLYKKDDDWNHLRQQIQHQLNTQHPQWIEGLLEKRNAQANGISERVIKYQHTPPKKTYTERIDQIILHPIIGIIGLLAVLIGIFYIIFTIAEIPKAWIESMISMGHEIVAKGIPAGEIQQLINYGILDGVGAVLAFLPQIALLFFALGLLESSGYLARAAFILDRPMQKVGLQGRSFIPFLSAYACAIPAIMATRTIESKLDRLATIFIAPWASCSARLPVYLMVLGMIYPPFEEKPLLKATALLGLYTIGTISAFLAAWGLRGWIIKGDNALTIIELPLYRWPHLKTVLWDVWNQSKLFITRAGTIILGLSILIWYALSHPYHPEWALEVQLKHSYAGQLGLWLEPILKPLGFNWEIGIGLIAAFAAREVFVSTLSIIYGMNLEAVPNLTHALFTPLTGISLLIFFIYAMQCISTVAIVKKETHSWRWPLFQFIFMTGTAYGMSFIVYQIGSWLGYT